MITVAGLAVRVRRLEELTRSLAKEVVLWKEGNDPLLHRERKAYLTGLQNALAGLDDSRVALAQVRDRLAGGSGPQGEGR